MTSVIHGAQVAIEIRRLGPEDAHVLERVAPEVFDELVRPDRLAAYLAEPGHHLWVAITDGKVVAQAAAVFRSPAPCRRDRSKVSISVAVSGVVRSQAGSNK